MCKQGYPGLPQQCTYCGLLHQFDVANVFRYKSRYHTRSTHI